MLLPFQWAVLTIDEAKFLLRYIEETTAEEHGERDYVQMQKVGVLEIYKHLREFVESSRHYEDRIRFLDPDDFQREERS